MARFTKSIKVSDKVYEKLLNEFPESQDDIEKFYIEVDNYIDGLIDTDVEKYNLLNQYSVKHGENIREVQAVFDLTYKKIVEKNLEESMKLFGKIK